VKKSTIRRICNDLTNSSTELPYQTTIKSDETLTVRVVQLQDLGAIAEMCVQEYDSGPDAFPINDPKRIPEWIDRQALYALVYWTTLVKLTTQEENPEDHAVIVGCINDKVVSMIEISQQPVLPERNPPPIPYPLSLKQLFCSLTKTPLQGWICNLLVVPDYRGRGLSKILVAAAEGLANHSWQCTSVHLHCDADPEDGRIPQRLYQSMDYQMLPADAALQWIPDTKVSSSIVMVEGVPLLYLRKDLIRS